jgi:hypothetical protein
MKYKITRSLIRTLDTQCPAAATDAYDCVLYTAYYCAQFAAPTLEHHNS